MKLFMIALSILWLLSPKVHAQKDLIVTASTGYSLSVFENQNSVAGSWPLSLAGAIEVAPQLEIGANVRLALGGYAFDGEFFGQPITTTFRQHSVGTFLRYLMPLGSISPFIKIGSGYYFGNSSYDLFGHKQEKQVKGAFGLSVGAGMLLTDHLNAEFIYNDVSRESDDQAFDANTWMFLVGYRFILGS